MPLKQKPFKKRLRQIQRQHAGFAHGYTMTMDRKSHLMVPRARSAPLRFPWGAVCIVLLLGLAFKSYLMVELGSQTYAMRLAQLALGHPLEQAGAWVMQPEPVSDAVAMIIGKLQG